MIEIRMDGDAGEIAGGQDGGLRGFCDGNIWAGSGVPRDGLCDLVWCAMSRSGVDGEDSGMAAIDSTSGGEGLAS